MDDDEHERRVFEKDGREKGWNETDFNLHEA